MDGTCSTMRLELECRPSCEHGIVVREVYALLFPLQEQDCSSTQITLGRKPMHHECQGARAIGEFASTCFGG